MTITPPLFEAFLKCPTKCWLRFTGEPPAGNEYAEWVQAQTESYRAEGAKRLTANAPAEECVIAPIAENFRTSKWLLAFDVPMRIEVRSSRGPQFAERTSPDGQQLSGGLGKPDEAQTSSSQLSTSNPQPNDQSLITSAATVVESSLHAVERVPSEGRGKAAQLIPIRFIFRNKLTTDDKLLLGFDALVLSQMLGRDVSLGKIIHGDDHATLKVKLGARTAESARSSAKPSGLLSEVRKRIEKMTALLSGNTIARSAGSLVRESQGGGDETRGLGGPRSVPAPDLVLNRHCAECEFRDRCRKIAIEKDDLSLLAGMSAKERQKVRSKGIFTVTQLSYTFRPRRRPKRLRDKREKYHHSLKALAIREQKIHIVGSPELKIEGTPVYLDVEGLPDRDFYYLIGLRIGNGDSAVQHSLWADTVADEGKIWREFLAILETVEQPVLIHYGSYETDFLKLMGARHGGQQDNSSQTRSLDESVNVLSVMFAQIYFPTFTNGLKDIAAFLGFKWSEAWPSGLQTIVRRHTWQNAVSQEIQQKLRNYNAEDCQALEIVTQALRKLDSRAEPETQKEASSTAVVHTELLPHKTMWPRFKSPFAEFEQVNKAARWDYQRDRVYVRSSKHIRRIAAHKRSPRAQAEVTPKQVVYREPELCPTCHQKGFRHFPKTRRVFFDIYFGRFNVRRRVVEFSYHIHWCPKCRARFGIPPEFWPKSKYGRNLAAYVIYHIIKLYIPMGVIGESVNRFLGFGLTQPVIHNIKVRAARYYGETRKVVLTRLVNGHLIHVDETRVSIKGRTGYVWVFTNLHEVAYVYSDSREGEFAQNLLRDFKGVLLSDFYAAYDAIDCPQQKCLIHLMRDLRPISSTNLTTRS